MTDGQPGDGVACLPLHGELLDQLYEGVYYVDRDRTITFWNRGAEQITGFSRADVVGRPCFDNILGHVDDEGRPLCRRDCPLAATIADGQGRECRVYLHHRDGYRQPVRVRTTPVRDASGTIVGAVEVFHDDSELVAVRQHIEELERLAILDPLTGVGNRRYAEMQVSARLRDLRLHGWGFGLLFVDVDRFKLVNDGYGHDVGDEVLRTVARTLAYGGGSSGAVARWGGEELLVMIAVGSEEELWSAAERLRMLVEQSAVSHQGHQIGVTVSIGATLARPSDTLHALVERADRLMYQSKAAGRNRVTVDGLARRETSDARRCRTFGQPIDRLDASHRQRAGGEAVA